MAAPIVSWKEYSVGSGFTDFTTWSIGNWDTGSTTPAKRVYIWNNYNSSEAGIADMENSSFTTKDLQGGNTGEPIVDKWIHVTCTGGLPDTAVGGTTVYSLKAKDSGIGDGIIQGGINTGNINDDTNFAEVDMWAVIDPLATPGTYQFYIRVGYSFV